MRKLKFDLGQEPDPTRSCHHCEHLDALMALKLDKVQHEWTIFRALIVIVFTAAVGVGGAVLASFYHRVPDAPPPPHPGETLFLDRVERSRDGGSR